MNLKSLVKRFAVEEDGATMVEYVLLVSLIGVIAITAMKFLGHTAANKLNTAAANVSTSS